MGWMLTKVHLYYSVDGWHLTCFRLGRHLQARSSPELFRLIDIRSLKCTCANHIDSTLSTTVIVAPLQSPILCVPSLRKKGNEDAWVALWLPEMAFHRTTKTYKYVVEVGVESFGIPSGEASRGIEGCLRIRILDAPKSRYWQFFRSRLKKPIDAAAAADHFHTTVMCSVLEWKFVRLSFRISR